VTITWAATRPDHPIPVVVHDREAPRSVLVAAYSGSGRGTKARVEPSWTEAQSATADVRARAHEAGAARCSNVFANNVAT
jgi:hypothetical protein